jgi:uncharacterized protein
MNASNRVPNHLIHESSLYLRQHAYNPVHWYPWGDEAIQKAKQLDRPIFLSIGYSACHWCHVMEHESFENDSIAQLMNDHFICIKVDREERPDLDTIYMTSLQIMTREGGGWPLSVWLTPDLHPFYSGTYFPPDNRYGHQRPSFPTLLKAIDEAWHNKREEIEERSKSLTEYLNEMTKQIQPDGELDESLLTRATESFQRTFDFTHGGFGHAPKFPHALELRMLLRQHLRTGNATALQMVKLALDKMAMGGIYDHLAGGFARYSVDQYWLVPHFEKMLYDNALLLRAFAEAWQVTKDPFYEEIAGEIVQYLQEEMTSPPGGFYSTQDADSEGEEGKFYVWSKSEIESILKEKAERFCYVYGVTESGNFEGHSILNRSKTLAQLARMQGIDEPSLKAELAESRKALLEVRRKRVWPGRDEKILTAWNGLMIAALAKAGAVFQQPTWLQMACKAMDYVLMQLRTPEGGLKRTCGVDQPAKYEGYLEDYSAILDALVELHQATQEIRWLESTNSLAEVMIAKFADHESGGFFFSEAGQDHLIVRNKETHDGSTPSGNSMAALALLQLGRLLDRPDFFEIGMNTIRAFRQTMHDSPGGSANMLTAFDFLLGPVQELVLIIRQIDPEKPAILRELQMRFGPQQLLVVHDPDTVASPLIPSLMDKKYLAEVTLYVCEGMSCKAPIVGKDAIMEWIGR